MGLRANLACLVPEQREAAIGLGAAQRGAARHGGQTRPALAHLQKTCHSISRRCHHQSAVRCQLQAPNVVLRHAHLDTTPPS